MPVSVTVWNEDCAAECKEQVLAVYPQGVLGAVAAIYEGQPEFKVRTAWLSQPEAGLTEEILDDTDVLVWWGHCKHSKVPDEIVTRVQQRVLRGQLGQPGRRAQPQGLRGRRACASALQLVLPRRQLLRWRLHSGLLSKAAAWRQSRRLHPFR